MKVAFFDAHNFERTIFLEVLEKLSLDLELDFIETRLTENSLRLAEGYEVVCAFVNDKLTQAVISHLASKGLKLVALRSAGYNQVDLEACKKFGVKVVRVPAYSPHAVAEHALALILTLNRKLHRAYNRVRELNFSLEGLVGFDLYKKTVGVMGTGKIGQAFAEAMLGLGCKVLAYDPFENPELKNKVSYVSKETLYQESDIISLHVPLNADTRHIINEQAICMMKTGVMLINTGRGALLDARALIEALKEGKIGSAGLDVYEEEEGIFFFDLSAQVLQDDVLARLLSFPNVLITSHQAFLTKEALQNIAETTLKNIAEYAGSADKLTNEVAWVS